MTEAKPSPEIVRAWFDTVLNPLSEALRSELRYLDHGNLAWRFRDRRSIVIRPFHELLHPDAEPNLEQFLDFKPEMSSALNSYDRQVETLTNCLRAYHATLVSNGRFLELFDMYRNEANHIFVSAEEDLKDFLAEYVINNISELSNIYSTANFWNAHSKEFLACRDLPGVKSYRDATEKAATHLAGIIRSLTHEVRSLRTELSYSFGVPIVESVPG